MRVVVHFLSGLEVGGKERIALDLARHGRALGLDHRLLVFDTPFRDAERDFDPGDVPVDFLPRGPRLDLRFPRTVARRLDELEADVLHAHNDTAVFYAAIAARLARRRPRVVGTFHTRPSHPTRAGRFLTRWASKRAHAITAVSDDLREFLLERRWVARCETLWNGVDLDAFRPARDGEDADAGWRERLGVEPRETLVVHLGRFDPLKRQEDLIDAARRLADRPLAFVLAGQGPTLEAARRAAEGVPGVRLVPRVQDVAGFLRAADVFVLCSREEAAPLVLLEAMATGLAIVATDVGGVRYMLTPPGGEPAGRLVRHGRPELLAEALGAVAQDRELANALGRAARARAADFSRTREWAAYAELYGG